MSTPQHVPDSDTTKDNAPPRGWWARHRIVTVLFLAAAAFYLVTEHRAHLWGILPWLIILACPLMHLFMHHGHGHRGHSDKSGRD